MNNIIRVAVGTPVVVLLVGVAEKYQEPVLLVPAAWITVVVIRSVIAAFRK